MGIVSFVYLVGCANDSLPYIVIWVKLGLHVVVKLLPALQSLFLPLPFFSYCKYLVDNRFNYIVLLWNNQWMVIDKYNKKSVRVLCYKHE